MARGIIRKPSFNKVVGAYRSQWKRFWLRLFGLYAPRGWGWLRDPKKAWYNFWYNRTSVSIYSLLGCKPSKGSAFFAMIVAAVIGICAAPVDAVNAGVKVHKIKKERKEKEKTEKTEKPFYSQKKTATGKTVTKTPSQTKPKTETVKSQTPVTYHTSSRQTAVNTSAPKEIYEDKFTPLFEKKENDSVSETPVREYSENTPKSTPKNEKDQYISKRMLIADADEEVLSKLTAGTYIDLVAEGDDVILVCNGSKTGRISEEDRLVFTTCLKLGRKVYGVITELDTESGKYEFETWFEK